ncbi:DUF4136 domain-containing protein [Aurantiacibacter sp. MUD11]|uniref:DUF4136 domain-containing protein n=1 Tax=Aurantiacibacter sp. MUD11 TaxID=3003265 RepID=UPI0022AA9D84|nr:DUF4136 domain-containing protein [Aurantiacibacter sp. MUD11]WAT16803.1 DUF4136 domain-containing protein [Aurantiacibacter sp. MUD11]
MRTIVYPFLAAGLLLSGCATPAYVSPVEVTRFVGEAPTELGQGTIAVQAAPGLDPQSLEYGMYRQALETQLQALGYTIVAMNPQQVAQLDVEQFVTAPEGRGRSVGVGGGASTGSYGSGVGVGVGIDLSSLINGPPPERIERQVSVAIRQPDGGPNLWEGRASMVATGNSDFAADAAAAPRIVEALFSGFPGESGETIAVE